ncbi:hypothetical protein FJ937_23395 [Mesorhizobium sp. B2-4-4]|uniref:hypothetical protein n=1 Tax=Mesorhizobium sp. B2-4-4 TaxID=2589945 RepID=UPI00112CA676|nr:hypothetical protein [Mesorhizobium sp. B2-4-4]TPL46335.1 hypothetical protein FJ937_23395 [Mesorhizobium sp. B2-4-4]
MAVILIRAFLIVAGVVYMAGAALRRGRLSDPAPAASDRRMPNLARQAPTLEPRRRGLGFLGVSQNWPGLLMMAVGAVLLLSAVVL